MDIRVFKIGGQIVDDEVMLSEFLSAFSKVKGQKLLVHGGGKIANRLCEQMGIEPKMHEGRRITDTETLKIVVMAYGGLINKGIVSKLQSLSTNATGLTGADSNIIEAHKRVVTGIDYGFAGDIDKVNAQPLLELLNQNICPVLAPLTHDTSGQMLNTNADTIANEISAALSVGHDVQLYYIFDKSGVLKDINDENSVIPNIKTSEISKLHQNGIIADGMLPKLHNARQAVEKGVSKVILTNVTSISKILSGISNVGTTITY